MSPESRITPHMSTLSAIKSAGARGSAVSRLFLFRRSISNTSVRHCEEGEAGDSQSSAMCACQSVQLIAR